MDKREASRTSQLNHSQDRPCSVEGLDFVAVVTADVERLEDFYSKVLGATVAASLRLPSGARLTVLDVGSGTQLHLYEAHGRRPQETHPRHHFGVRVRNEDALARFVGMIRQLGVGPVKVDDAGPWWSVEFDDPDGNRARTVCFKPELTLASLYSTAARLRGSAAGEARPGALESPPHPDRAAQRRSTSPAHDVRAAYSALPPAVQ